MGVLWFLCCPLRPHASGRSLMCLCPRHTLHCHDGAIVCTAGLSYSVQVVVGRGEATEWALSQASPPSAFPLIYRGPHRDRHSEIRYGDTETCTHTDTQRWRDTYGDMHKDTRRDMWRCIQTWSWTHTSTLSEEHRYAQIKNIGTCRLTQDTDTDRQMET